MKRESIISAGRLALVAAIGLATVAVAPAQAQKLKVIHSFTGGNDGANPVSGLMMAPDGAMFGTASSGGTAGDGVVFQVNAMGKETVLHSFAGGADGAVPNGGVIRNAKGDLFGTTTAGGTAGAGTVFEVAGPKETVLYSFAGGTDGSVPDAGLVMDAAGNLYGTTTAGGTAGTGTVFELAAPRKAGGKWTETILYSFAGGTDGSTPIGGLYLDSLGNLYGTTSVGGAYGYGTVFELTPGSTWTETILHSFQSTTDGSYPYAGLVADASGNLYGAATDGGANGGGTTFELTPSAGSWNFNVLTSQPGWGISGTFRDVMVDGAGNVYAATHCDGNNSAGTIYRITPSGAGWTYTLLYTFTGGGDGEYSISNLVMKNGKLYGTTIYGGANNGGVIYQLNP
jgi:uncharacterized repeat protein (TIGR03803 family)